jgi:hypothetical protein
VLILPLLLLVCVGRFRSSRISGSPTTHERCHACGSSSSSSTLSSKCRRCVVLGAGRSFTNALYTLCSDARSARVSPPATHPQLPSECAILALAYTERLIGLSGITLHASNWRRVVLSTVILASKGTHTHTSRRFEDRSRTRTTAHAHDTANETQCGRTWRCGMWTLCRSSRT